MQVHGRKSISTASAMIREISAWHEIIGRTEDLSVTGYRNFIEIRAYTTVFFKK